MRYRFRGAMMATLVLATIGFASFASNLAAQQRPAPTFSQEKAAPAYPDTVGAALAGIQDGSSKSVMMPAFAAGSVSFLIPGSGLLYLLFMHEGQVQPNYVQSVELKDKSPTYVKIWSSNYDQTLTGRQKKAVYIGTAVGSVVGALVLWRPLLQASSQLNSYGY